jgi:PAS domain S-box-containing protein
LPVSTSHEVFVGDSEMARLMRAKDWTATPLGAPETWPEALKVAVRILLTSRFEMWLGWGPDIAFFYNDAYRPTLGDKHPQALAAPTRELWAEIWPDIEGRIRAVYERGEATWDRALQLLLVRRGYPEETYHTFSYSPLLGDSGAVEGMFCAVSEETERVIAARRLDSLRALAAGLAVAEGRAAVMDAVATALSTNPEDLPFSLTYLFESGEPRLACATGWKDGRVDPAALPSLPLGEDGALAPLEGAGPLPTGAWKKAPARAAILSLVGQGGEAPIGALAVGLNPHRPFDDDYQAYLRLAAGQIAAGLASADAFEMEQRRAAAMAEAARMRAEAASALQKANARLATEVELRTAERDRLRNLFQRAPSFMAVLRGPDHVFEFINESYLQLVGHRDLIGLPVRAAVPEIEGQGFFEVMDKVYRTGEPFTGRGLAARLQRAPDAPLEQRFINLIYQPIVEADGSISGIFVEGSDVTDRVEAEESLRRLAETLEQQVEARTRERDMVWRTSQDLFVLIEPDGAYDTVNPAWTAALGYTHEELVGRNAATLIHPEDLQARAADLERVAQGEALRDLDLRLQAKDGSYRWFSWTTAPAEGGQIFCEGRDITDRRSLEEQLRQAQKMEAVGQLTGGIAHDFNNLLTGIIGSLELLQKRIAQGRTADLDRFVGAATTSANRAAALTHRLLAFSRRQPLDPKPVDANRLISSMEDLLRRTIGEAIQFELITAGGLWRTLCDPHQLESSILNLAINARDAMPDGGKLTIETCNAHLDNAYAARQREVKPGQYICICVTDTGTGMTSDVIERAFDPFFTTKPMGRGTGLGLSMIYGFTRQSDGYVKIYSELGQGTTVRLYLPRFRGEEGDEEANVQRTLDMHRADAGETVLVVEDEASVRELVVEVLSELGYHTLEAVDGPSGLQMIEAAPAIDLLITDVGLPGLNGRQLADAARNLKPGLQVLFMTGYAENAAVGHGFLEPGMEMITKPFPLDVLAERIRRMIEGGRP